MRSCYRLSVLTVVVACAQASGPIVVLHNFTGGADSAQPTNGVIQIGGGGLVGSSAPSSVNTAATLFLKQPDGALGTLWMSRIEPPSQGGIRETFITGRVLEASDGNLYAAAATADGDVQHPGAIFRFNASGASPVYYFTAAQGPPSGGLIEGSDGNFYGVAAGSPPSHYTPPVVYRLTPGGQFTPLASLNNQNAGGGLTQGSDGDFYGVTLANGITGGSVYRVTPAGVLTILHVFQFTDGSNPHAGLAELASGVFCGTTADGGANNLGVIFQLAADGQFTVLYSFDGQYGQHPSSGLLLAKDGNLYGTTGEVIGVSLGTIYQFTGSTLHSFPLTIETGYAPTGELTQIADGSIVGVALYGGSSPALGGTIYALQLKR